MNTEFNSGAINATDCISEGWNLFSANAGMYIGFCLLFVCMSCILIVINWFLSGPILAGVYYVYLRQIRGEQVDFGMFFKGFQWFLPTMVVGLLILVPTIINQMFDIGIRIAQMVAAINQDEMSAGALMLITIGKISIGGVMLIGSIIMFIFFTFAIPLIIDRNLGLGDALKTSASAGWANVGGMILLLILEAVVLIVGVLACFVGLFAAIPVIWGANAVAYRMVFPDTQSGMNMAPPTPDQYAFQ